MQNETKLYMVDVKSLLVQLFTTIKMFVRKSEVNETTHGLSWWKDPTTAADNHGRACCSLCLKKQQSYKEDL